MSQALRQALRPPRPRSSEHDDAPLRIAMLAPLRIPVPPPGYGGIEAVVDLLSGQADYFREHIEPHIDGMRVRYIGEVTGAPKRQLYARAAALLMPIRWEEPFGTVMSEALACGTPVVAFPEGAAGEIVIDGHNGLLVTDEADMARATTPLASVDPHDCRHSARSRYDIAITADGYDAVYRRAQRSRPRRGVSIDQDRTPQNGHPSSAPGSPTPREG